MRAVKFKAYGVNDPVDPRLREGSGHICNYCKKPFSFWDDLQISPHDLKYLCANCKGIQIELITEPND